tara:strand:+ start:474 stop:959 length:486 start_codon:yes stop_codon:yes gene_type:complete
MSDTIKVIVPIAVRDRLIWDKLEDVPLPDRIYNGPLDEKIVPLVRAVRSHSIETIGSDDGTWKFHYPWVQMYPYNDFEWMKIVLEGYNNFRDVKWNLQGNVIRPYRNARTLEDLKDLQSDIPIVSQYIFLCRPEVLVRSYLDRNPDVSYDDLCTGEMHLFL